MQIDSWERAQKRISDIIQILGTAQASTPSQAPALRARQELNRLMNWDGPLGASPTQQTAKSSPFASQLQALIKQESAHQQVAPHLVEALVKVESGGRSGARSSKGALGLMQLMPGTARTLGVNPLDPQENLSGGIRYLKAMARRFGDLDLALAAYNAGPGAVEKYGGVPPYKETRQYIQKIRKQL